MIIIEDKQNKSILAPVRIIPKYKVLSAKKARPSRRKTTETYKRELSIINPTIECLGEYTTSKDKILHKCKKCNHQWYAMPTNTLRGKGCPICGQKIINDKLRVPKEQYLNELIQNGSRIELVSGYYDMTTPCLHRCINCDYYWEERPSTVIKRKYCPKCKGYGSIKDRLKTAESYTKELLDKNIPVKLEGKYINSLTKVLHRCLLHDYLWETTPSRVLSGNGCPKCKADKTSLTHCLSHEGYLSRLKEIDSDLIPLERYINIHTPILHQYPCGHVRSVSPACILQGHGCKLCACKLQAQDRVLSQEEFETKVYAINPTIKILGKYENAYTRIECQCQSCNWIWSPIAYSLVSGFGCPQCKKSKGEQKIKKILDTNGILYVPQMKFDDLYGLGNRSLSYDFYLVNYNTLIEYQGGQHEKPVAYFGGEDQFKIQQEHDKRKREYAKEHNINLLEIWYYDYDKIEEILIKYLNLETVETVIPA